MHLIPSSLTQVRNRLKQKMKNAFNNASQRRHLRLLASQFRDGVVKVCALSDISRQLSTHARMHLCISS